MWPQVPAEQRTQALRCTNPNCGNVEIIGIDEEAEDHGWHKRRCPDCACTVPARRRVTDGVANVTAKVTAEVTAP